MVQNRRRQYFICIQYRKNCNFKGKQPQTSLKLWKSGGSKRTAQILYRAIRLNQKQQGVRGLNNYQSNQSKRIWLAEENIRSLGRKVGGSLGDHLREQNEENGGQIRNRRGWYHSSVQQPYCDSAELYSHCLQPQRRGCQGNQVIGEWRKTQTVAVQRWILCNCHVYQFD